METKQKNNLVLQGRGSEFDLSGILQMIEAQGLCGTFALGRHSLDFYAGQVVRASEDATDTVSAITAALGVFTFHKTKGAPSGDLRLSLTALLLEAARRRDEERAQQDEPKD